MNQANGAARSGVLPLLTMAAAASMASMRVCDPLLTMLANEFAVSTGVAAQAISAFAVAYGLLQLFYGPVGDRFGKTRVITCAVAACAVCNVAVALAPTFTGLVICRALAGAAAAGIIPLTMAWIGDTVPYEDRQQVLARLLTGTIFGMIAGQWIGGFGADAVGWRPVFFVLAALFAISAFLLHRAERVYRTSERHATGPGSTAPFITQLVSVLHGQWARRVLAAAGLEGAFAFSAFSFVPSYLHERFGLSLGAAGAILALYGVGGMVYAVLAKHLVRRAGERGLAVGGGAGLGLSMAMLAFGGHWWWSMPACLVGGLGFYMLHSTLQTNATQMAPQARGTAVSAFAACLFTGQSVGVLAGSYILDLGSPTLIFMAGMVVLPILGWWFSRSLARREEWLAAPVKVKAL